jgi:hypothetical protein
VLDPLYPYDPQSRCDRCDRGVDRPDERSVQRLLLYPTVDAFAAREETRYVTVCADCQRRAKRLVGELGWLADRPGDDRTDLPTSCGRCGADGGPADGVLSSWHGRIGPYRWEARLCEGCTCWLDDELAAFVQEPTPYDGEWYRPPDLRRAEAAIEQYAAADTGSITATYERLEAGDLVRLVADRRGWRSRGQYLQVLGRVERVMTSLREGPPERIEVRTVEHELSVNVGGKRQSWAAKIKRDLPIVSDSDTEPEVIKRDLPVVSVGDAELEVSALSHVCPASGADL